jgi:hypothetical protein
MRAAVEEDEDRRQDEVQDERHRCDEADDDALKLAGMTGPGVVDVGLAICSPSMA